jgi:SWI/SNF-related matrix-associated actin-dependent regulator 1 of chromatin subfamily A
MRLIIFPSIFIANNNQQVSKITKKEAKMGAKSEIKTIRDAIQFLASLDADRAIIKNKLGFNKFDSGIGHYLAKKPYWTKEDLEIAITLVNKYRRQLGFHSKEEILKSLDTSPEANKVVESFIDNEFGEIYPFAVNLREGKILPEKGIAELKFDYDPFPVDEIKKFPVKYFDSDTKTWFVGLLSLPAITRLRKFIKQFPNFENFRDIYRYAKKLYEDYPFKYEVKSDGGNVIIQLPKDIPPGILKPWTFGTVSHIVYVDNEKKQLKIGIDKAISPVVIEKLEQTFPRKVFKKIIEEVFKKIDEFEKSSQSEVDEETEKFIQSLNLKINLFNYQKVGVKRGYELIKKHNKVLITDEMGLGKTFQAIGIVKALEQNGDNPYPVLIIAPKSILYNWREEIEKIFGEEEKEKVIVLSGSPKRATEYREALKKGKELKDFRWIVINYQSVIKWKDIFKETPIGTIILDEFHYIKNPKAKTTKAVKELLGGKKLIALSGTPFLNRVWELGDVLDTLGVLPLLGLDKKQFNQTFVFYTQREVPIRGERRVVWVPVGGKNLERLNLILRSVMIRREKKDVLTELPPKIRKEVWIELSPADRKAYNSLEEEFDNLIANYKLKASERNEDWFTYMLYERRDPVFLRKVNELFYTLSKLKVPYVFDYVKELAETLGENEKFVVFAYTKEAQNKLYELFKEHGFNPLRINAEMKQEERGKAVKQFQESDENKVIVVSLGAGAEGITLTRAKNLIFADLWYQPQKLIQAEDRIHRVGQNDVANIHYILAKDTIDEKVWNKIIKSKLEEFDRAIKNQYLKDKILSAKEKIRN